MHVNVYGLEDLSNKIDAYGEGAHAVVQKYLLDEGWRVIGDSILDDPKWPVSGRRWKGKSRSILDAYDFTREFGPGQVTVSAAGKWSYYYFPDDGSNTRKHAGQKHFFDSGLETAKPTLIDGILSALAKAFNEA